MLIDEFVFTNIYTDHVCNRKDNTMNLKDIIITKTKSTLNIKNLNKIKCPLLTINKS